MTNFEPLPFRLLHGDWEAEILAGLEAEPGYGRIMCPFMKEPVLRRLLGKGLPSQLQVITRFDLDDCVEGVQDLVGLRFLLDRGARVRAVRGVHAKLYVFGLSRAIITSANLTESGLARNHELGIVCLEPATVAACAHYFDGLWERAGSNLTIEQLGPWEKEVAERRAAIAQAEHLPALGDRSQPVLLPQLTGLEQQAFVKFQGEGTNRASLNLSTLEAVQMSGCHWAVAYPKGKRPRGVKDGALLFIARLTKDPNDVRIFGRAVARAYQPGRDDATEADIQLRGWKEKWPHYIRVDQVEFVDGPLGAGVSLNDLMDRLRASAFASTKRNAAQGRGNTNPRKAYSQQPAVELSPEGVQWITQRLEAAFLRYGRIAPAALSALDQPAPGVASAAKAGSR